MIGCELGAGVVDLESILDVVRHDSPGASLNIGVSAAKHVCPALEDEYLRGLPDATAGDLGRTLRLVRDRGLPREPELLVERGARERDVLAAEEDLVVRSVQWADRVVGRAGSKMGEIDE
jgi:hypothetical protein